MADFHLVHAGAVAVCWKSDSVARSQVAAASEIHRAQGAAYVRALESATPGLVKEVFVPVATCAERATCHQCERPARLADPRLRRRGHSRRFPYCVVVAVLVVTTTTSSRSSATRASAIAAASVRQSGG